MIFHQTHPAPTIIPILWSTELRLREVKQLSQRHTAGKCLRWDLNPARIQESFMRGRKTQKLVGRGLSPVCLCVEVGAQVGRGQSKIKDFEVTSLESSVPCLPGAV